MAAPLSIRYNVLERILGRRLDGYTLQMVLEALNINVEAPGFERILAYVRGDEASFESWLAQSRVWRAQRANDDSLAVDSSEPLPRSIGLGDQRPLTALRVGGSPTIVSIPRELGALTRLRALTVYSVPLDTLPDVFESMTSLEQLTLIDVPRLAALPASVGAASSLQMLVVRDAPRLATMPESLSTLPALRFIALTNVGLSSWPARRRAPFGTLTSLIIDGAPALDALPAWLATTRRLDRLIVRRTNIDVIAPAVARRVDIVRFDAPERAFDGSVRTLWDAYLQRAVAPRARRWMRAVDEDGDSLFYVNDSLLIDRWYDDFTAFWSANNIVVRDESFDDAFSDSLTNVYWDLVDSLEARALVRANDSAIDRIVDSLNADGGLPDWRLVADAELAQSYRTALEALEACPQAAELVSVVFRREHRLLFYDALIERYISLIDELLRALECS